MAISNQQHQNHNGSDDDVLIQSPLTTGGRNYFQMDEAFCDRMFAAIRAGLENAPIGVVTTPGTKNPRYVPTEPRPLPSSQRARSMPKRAVDNSMIICRLA